MNPRLAAGLGAVAALVALASAAFAGDSPATPRRFEITASGTFASLDTQASLGPSGGGVGASLTLEDLFNVPVHKRFVELDGTWNYSGRHHVDAGFINVERTGQSQVDNEFQFGDYTFMAGATAEAYFASTFVYAAYRYDMVQAGPIAISASIGINATRLEMRLTGSGGIVDTSGQAVDGTTSVEGKVPLPVPLLGIQVDWEINNRSRFQTYQRLVGIDSPNLRGSMTQWKIRYHYFVTSNVGLGLGYEALDVRMPKFESEDRMLRFSYGIRGFTFGLQGVF